MSEAMQSNPGKELVRTVNGVDWLRLPIKRGRRTVTCSRCQREFKSFFL